MITPTGETNSVTFNTMPDLHLCNIPIETTELQKPIFQSYTFGLTLWTIAWTVSLGGGEEGRGGEGTHYSDTCCSDARYFDIQYSDRTETHSATELT